MANFQRLRPSGLWVDASVIPQEEFEALDAIRPKLINAAEGSVHAPTGWIVIGDATGTGNAGLHVTGGTKLNSIQVALLAPNGVLTIVDTSEVRVVNGAFIKIKDGGLLLVEPGGEIRVGDDGILSCKPGSKLKIEGEATLAAAAELTLDGLSTVIAAGGSAVNLGGDTTLTNGTWLKLAPARSWERHSLTIACTTLVSGTPQASKAPSNLAGGVDMIETVSTSSSAQSTLIELNHLPDGGTLSGVVIESQGVSGGGVNLVLPRFQIIRWKGTAAAQLMSSLTPYNGVTATYDSTLATTTVTASDNTTIDNNYRYGLRVFHAYDGAPSGGLRVYDVKASGTTERYGL